MLTQIQHSEDNLFAQTNINFEEVCRVSVSTIQTDIDPQACTEE